MRRGTIGPGELRTAEITKLPDGRYRVQRWKTLSASRDDASSSFAVYGSADPVPARGVSGGAGNGVRLIQQEIIELDGKPYLHLVYETIPATGEIQAGLNTRIKLEDGREAIEADFLQLSSDTYLPGTVGTTTAPGDASAYLKESVQTNDGTVRRIKRTYVYAGIIATDDQSLNNGALLKKSITSVKTVPTTPSGFTLVGSPVQSPLGLPVYTYTYYKGEGQISYDPSSSNNGALLRIAIRHLTAPGASNPIATPGGYTLVSGPSFQEQEGHMVWSAGFAKGEGEISYDPSSDNNGALLRISIRHLTAPAASNPISTPSGYTLVSGPSFQEAEGHMVWSAGFAKGTGEIARSIDYSQSEDQGTIGVTRTVIRYLVVPSATVQPTSLSGSVEISRDVQELDGHRVWTTTWAKGTGLVSQLIASRQDGLREVTNIALGARVAPVGVVLRDDYRIDGGYKIFTVTCMQTAAGSGTVTGAAQSFERYVPFTYPGRAKAWVEIVGFDNFLDVFLAPPVSTTVKATVAISYTTSSSLGTISDYWNPTSWATMRANWVGAYGVAASRNQPLPGYRSVSATPVTLAGSGYDAAIFGYNIYAGEDGTITVTGGPADPGGGTWTLSAEIEPAFTDVDGTQYYRKILVTAAIPAQSALPV